MYHEVVIFHLLGKHLLVALFVENIAAIMMFLVNVAFASDVFFLYISTMCLLLIFVLFSLQFISSAKFD